MTKRIYLCLAHMSGNEMKFIQEAFDTNWVVPLGPNVNGFEKDLEGFVGQNKRVVALSSGTAAVHLGLLACGVGPGDEVLVQSFTFCASTHPITYLGATPVMVDSEPDTWNIDPDLLETAILDRIGKTGKKPKAIVPVALYGMPYKADRIMKIANKYGIPVVEDAAESIGSLYQGQHTGTFAKIGALSFNGNKTITTGGGGMLLFQDPAVGEHAKHLTTQAKMPHRWEFRHDEIGYNYRMPNINAALGCAQLENLDRFIESKRRIAAAYANFFKDVPGVQFFTEPDGCRSNYWLNAIILENREARDAFLEFSNDNGVMTRPVWELMNRLPMFEKCETDGLKNTLWLADRIVNIPSSAQL